MPSHESNLIFKHYRPAARGLLVFSYLEEHPSQSFFSFTLLYRLVWAAGVTSDFVIIKAAENPTVHKFSKKCKTHFLSLMKRIENVESRQEYHFYKQGRMTNVIPRTPQKCDKKLKGVSTLGANMITNIYANNTLNKKRYTKRDIFIVFFFKYIFQTYSHVDFIRVPIRSCVSILTISSGSLACASH